ncbi:V-type H+-transporting ATPase subunit D [Enteropsectra breve]|nr:V-type H+-transporting ATPase subunit D [Enteropsectra breve]
MGLSRLPVFPTRMNCLVLGNRLKNVRAGLEMLKAKAAALKIQYKELEQKSSADNANIGDIFKNAFSLLSRAEFYGADVNAYKAQCQKNGLSVRAETKSVCGIQIPVFQLIKTNIVSPAPLIRGGAELSKAQCAFSQAITSLVDIISIKNSAELLKKALTATNKRINALEIVIIPQLEMTIAFINTELDEKEREEFHKLKKVQKLNGSKF